MIDVIAEKLKIEDACKDHCMLFRERPIHQYTCSSCNSCWRVDHVPALLDRVKFLMHESSFLQKQLIVEAERAREAEDTHDRVQAESTRLVNENRDLKQVIHLLTKEDNHDV